MKDAATPSESIVGTSEINGADSKLSKGRCTHDTRFDCDVQIDVLENGSWVLAQDGFDPSKLCVTMALCNTNRSALCKGSTYMFTYSKDRLKDMSTYGK